MRKHKVTFTADYDDREQKYKTHLEHELNGRFGDNELARLMAEVVMAFTDIMAEAYTQATEHGKTKINPN